MLTPLYGGGRQSKVERFPGTWTQSWPPPSAGHDTGQVASRRNAGVRAQDWDRFTRRKEQAARRIRQSGELYTSHPDATRSEGDSQGLLSHVLDRTLSRERLGAQLEGHIGRHIVRDKGNERACDHSEQAVDQQS